MISAIKYNDSKYTLVFDDGGFIFSNPDNSGFKLNFELYTRILQLAQLNEVKIAIACTAMFFDIDGLYSKNNINPNIDLLIKFFHKNKDYIELWNHGLTHMTDNNRMTEFFCYEDGNIKKENQEFNIRTSQDIFSKIDLPPNIFVPPGHAWEQDVSDKIAAKYNIEHIAIREFEKSNFREWIKCKTKRYKKEWTPSKELNSLFRLGLGIAYNKTQFTKKDYLKSSHYINNTIPFSILANRKLKLKNSIDHFFAHIQNLQNSNSINYFDMIIKLIKKNKFNDIKIK